MKYKINGQGGAEAMKRTYIVGVGKYNLTRTERIVAANKRSAKTIYRNAYNEFCKYSEVQAFEEGKER
jgi:hypothetical protein